jgi:hypothetical protein
MGNERARERGLTFGGRSFSGHNFAERASVIQTRVHFEQLFDVRPLFDALHLRELIGAQHMRVSAQALEQRPRTHHHTLALGRFQVLLWGTSKRE